MGSQRTTIRNANATNGNAGVPARSNWAHLAVSRTALCGAIVLAGLAVAADWLRPAQPSVVPPRDKTLESIARAAHGLSLTANSRLRASALVTKLNPLPQPFAHRVTALRVSPAAVPTRALRNVRGAAHVVRGQRRPVRSAREIPGACARLLALSHHRSGGSFAYQSRHPPGNRIGTGDPTERSECASASESCPRRPGEICRRQRGCRRCWGSVELPSKSNYFIGNDPKQWHTNVPNYSAVKYTDGIYPGVDAVFHGDNQRFEFDFDIAPGANARSVALEVDGAHRMRLNRAGDLVACQWTRAHELIMNKPYTYQQSPRGPPRNRRALWFSPPATGLRSRLARTGPTRGHWSSTLRSSIPPT